MSNVGGSRVVRRGGPSVASLGALVALVGVGAVVSAVGAGPVRADGLPSPAPAPGACPTGHVCVWDGPNWTGRIQVLAPDLPGPDRTHPGRCLQTVFDVRSLYVAQDSVTAEVFGDHGCRLGRRSTVVSATAPQSPGISDIRTGSPMRSIDAYRNP
jgi:hypothetical protein